MNFNNVYLSLTVSKAGVKNYLLTCLNSDGTSFCKVFDTLEKDNQLYAPISLLTTLQRFTNKGYKIIIK